MHETWGEDTDELKFLDGEALKKQTSATFLGNDLNTRADLNVEVANKMCETRKAWLELAAYWKATTANTKWQLQLRDDVSLTFEPTETADEKDSSDDHM